MYFTHVINGAVQCSVVQPNHFTYFLVTEESENNSKIYNQFFDISLMHVMMEFTEIIN